MQFWFDELVNQSEEIRKIYTTSDDLLTQETASTIAKATGYLIARLNLSDAANITKPYIVLGDSSDDSLSIITYLSVRFDSPVITRPDSVTPDTQYKVILSKKIYGKVRIEFAISWSPILVVTS